MTSIDLDPRLIPLLEHRSFFTDDDDPDDYVTADDVVLDVLILARVKRADQIGTGDSALIVVTDNQTDNLMVSGMLHQAQNIQDQDGDVRDE